MKNAGQTEYFGHQANKKCVQNEKNTKKTLCSNFCKYFFNYGLAMRVACPYAQLARDNKNIFETNINKIRKVNIVII